MNTFTTCNSVGGVTRLEGRDHKLTLTVPAYQRFEASHNASLFLSCHGTLTQRSSCAATFGTRLQERSPAARSSAAAAAASAGVPPQDAVQLEGRPQEGVQTPDTVSTRISIFVFWSLCPLESYAVLHSPWAALDGLLA